MAAVDLGTSEPDLGVRREVKERLVRSTDERTGKEVEKSKNGGR
jgi:hypothetical protein